MIPTVIIVISVFLIGVWLGRLYQTQKEIEKTERLYNEFYEDDEIDPDYPSSIVVPFAYLPIEEDVATEKLKAECRKPGNDFPPMVPELRECETCKYKKAADDIRNWPCNQCGLHRDREDRWEPEE